MGRIKDARQKMGLTVREAAELAGISKSHYSAIENGKGAPSAVVALRLTEVLGIGFRDVLER